MSLWSELKRRNVVRVAAAYLVASWVLIEVGSLMFEAFGFPDFAIKLLIAGLALGLLPVLVLAWAYELTPEGVVKDSGSGRDNPEHRNTARRLDQVTIAMILIALAVLVVNQFVMPERVRPAVTEQATSAAVSEPARSAPTVAEIPDGPSVAVLPFANMSPDPDNEYFADGISEEILNVLASVEGLKVASRTSAFTFRESNKSIAEIAGTLGVANILEGSVRKQGNRVRITAQLIDAKTDIHRWSESYDRQLDDIFAVQEEIAQAITNALSDALGVASVSVRAPTQNLEAYEQFLKGRTLFYQRGDNLLSAREALESAVTLDPNFAEAWAVLAATAMVSPSYIAVDSEQAFTEAREAALKAQSLNDSLPMPYAILGTLSSFLGNQLEAERLLDEALKRDPDHGSGLLWRGLFRIAVGDFTGAEADLRLAHQLEPLVGINNGWLGTVRLLQGDLSEAEALLRRSVDLGWGSAGHLGLAGVEKTRGNRDKAEEHLKEFARLSPNNASDVEGDRAIAAFIAALDNPAAKPEFFAAVDAELEADPMARRGVMFLHLGEFDRALEHETRTQGAVNAMQWQMWQPQFREIVARPGFIAYAESSGLMEYWRAKGFPEGCSYNDQPEPRMECSW